jgi:hypothetical protein
MTQNKKYIFIIMEEKFKIYNGSYCINLNDYESHEIYDPNKKYDYEEYKINELTYQLGIVNDMTNKIKYVCPFNILNDNEKKELLKYCRCYKHNFEYFSDYFDLSKFFISAETCGCISSAINPNQGIIKKTREYMKYKKS